MLNNTFFSWLYNYSIKNELSSIALANCFGGIVSCAFNCIEIPKPNIENADTLIIKFLVKYNGIKLGYVNQNDEKQSPQINSISYFSGLI